MGVSWVSPWIIVTRSSDTRQLFGGDLGDRRDGAGAELNLSRIDRDLARRVDRDEAADFVGGDGLVGRARRFGVDRP